MCTRKWEQSLALHFGDFGTCGAISSMAMDHYGFGTGDEMRSQEESRTQGGRKKKRKEGTKLVIFFPPKLLLRVVSPPNFGFALPVPLVFTAAHFPPENQAIVRIRSCKSSEFIASFMKKQYPTWLT